MQFEVPQFIEIEDKIFGPLTWKQFVYLGGGVGAAAVSFLIFPFIIFVIVGIPIGLLSAALAFFPVNNRPFVVFLESIFSYVFNDKLYLWHQKADVVYNETTTKKTTETAPYKISPNNRGTKHKSISSLTRSLELEAMQKSE